MIRTQGADVDIHEPVVIVVSDGAAHAVHLHCQSGFAGDIGKGAVLVVAIQSRIGWFAFMPGPIHAVDEQDVLPAVVVVIEEGAARSNGFREILFPESAIVVSKEDTCLTRDVLKLNGEGAGWRLLGSPPGLVVGAKRQKQQN